MPSGLNSMPAPQGSDFYWGAGVIHRKRMFQQLSKILAFSKQQLPYFAKAIRLVWRATGGLTLVLAGFAANSRFVIVLAVSKPVF
jgi:hypothetical protein